MGIFQVFIGGPIFLLFTFGSQRKMKISQMTLRCDYKFFVTFILQLELKLYLIFFYKRKSFLKSKPSPYSLSLPSTATPHQPPLPSSLITLPLPLTASGGPSTTTPLIALVLLLLQPLKLSINGTEKENGALVWRVEISECQGNDHWKTNLPTLLLLLIL